MPDCQTPGCCCHAAAWGHQGGKKAPLASISRVAGGPGHEAYSAEAPAAIAGIGTHTARLALEACLARCARRYLHREDSIVPIVPSPES